MLLLATSAPAVATSGPSSGDVQAPVFKVGDDWIYDVSVEKGPTGFKQVREDFRIERVDGDTMLTGVKLAGAPTNYEDHLLGADWSKRVMVDGEEKVTTRPLKFPMRAGDTWSIDYTDTLHRGNQLSDHVRRTYTVSGWTDVTTPAGTFHALKVVAKGVDDILIQTPAAVAGGTVATSNGATSVAHTEKGGLRRFTRVTYGELDYVPALKNFAKTVEEQYTPDNVRVSRETHVLESFAPAS